jgi:ribosomal protein S18 acetylase RimI-like enzyme
VPAIVALLRDVAAEDRWIRTEIPFNTGGREQMMRTALTSGDLVSFVGERDGAVVAELSLRSRGARASFGMVVAVGERRRGIGRRLLAAAIAWARAARFAALDLDVYAHNIGAIELYRASGFVQTRATTFEERRNGERWEIIPMSFQFHE